MSIKLPIVNVKDINWSNHDSSIDIFQDIVVGDIAVIENKSECVLPLDDVEYCVTIDNSDIFIEEPFSYEECKILFGKDFETIEYFKIGDKVKIRKSMLKGEIVEIQKSMKGRKIFVVQITENTSNGYWEEELERVI